MDCEKECVAALRSGEFGALFEKFGFDGVALDVPAEALVAWGWDGGPVGQLRVVATTTGVRVVEGHDVSTETRRRLAHAVHRTNPLETTLWLWVDESVLTVALVDERPSGRPFVRSTTIDREHPDAVGLSRLARLKLDDVARPAEVDVAKAVREHFVEVLDQESVTREFFAGFRAALETLAEGLRKGPSDTRLAHDVCLVTLLRVVFLYFLQREGMLAGDRRFLVRRLRAAVREGDDFWSATLRPLFFGVLNTPRKDRDEVARSLGDIPFLNGGLFEPTPDEEKYPGIRWSTEVWCRVIEDVFERFHFTAVEPSGEDEAAVVDPEMLGKVFEGLMYGDERHRSGSFYTPRDVVRAMVDAALDAHLADAECDPEAALSRIRILDPAVGTGAFLLEALDALRRRRRALGLPTDYDAVRRLVHDHLFGVDRQRTAVRLCELRLWLAMLGAMRTVDGEVMPLPNLSHRIATGDSLLAMKDVGRFRDRDGLVLDAAARQRHFALERHLDGLQHRYLAAHGEEKRAVRREMERVERALQEQLLVSRRGALLRRLEPLRGVMESDDLFGESMATSSQLEQLARLEKRLTAVNKALNSVRRGRTSEAAFAYESRFGAAAREGFDLIITNPPWVRTQRIDPDTRAALRTRYSTAANTLWDGARELGIRAPFGTQPDLAALFIERSMELLRPGGRLTALVPAKLFRSLGGSALRALVSRYSIERIEDLSEADRSLFDATTYPAILRVRKTDAPCETSVVVWRGRRATEFRRETRRLPARSWRGAPWVLVPDDVREIFDRMMERSVPLGTVASPRRGIFTGANDVFIRERGQFVEKLGASVAQWVRPIIAGSGLSEPPTLEVVWPYDEAGTLSTDLPPELVTYFERHAARLRARSDFKPSLPLWQMFRVRDDTLGPKVAWRDMSVCLEPVEVRADAVPLNTVYYVSCSEPERARAFATWMGSTPVCAYAHALAERARGGWRRHFAWLVRMLPVPRSIARSGWVVGTDEQFGLREDDLRVLEDWLAGDVSAVQEAA